MEYGRNFHYKLNLKWVLNSIIRKINKLLSNNNSCDNIFAIPYGFGNDINYSVCNCIYSAIKK